MEGLCPRLKTLEVDQCMSWTPGLLLRVVEQRAAKGDQKTVGQSLRRVRISGGLIDEGTVKAMDDLLVDGALHDGI